MATAACLPIAADRAGPCVRTIFFEGLDLTGITLAFEARLNPETPGPAPIVLGMGATANAEGLRMTGVMVSAGVPTSTVVLRINEATMKDAAKVPYSGELGSASHMVYDLIGIFGQDKRRLCYGEIVALPTVYGMDGAPLNRSISQRPASGEAASWNSARLIFSDGRVVVKIDGADLVGFEVAKAGVSAALATAERQKAEAAAGQAANVVEPYKNTVSKRTRAAGFGAALWKDGAGRIAMILSRDGRRLRMLGGALHSPPASPHTAWGVTDAIGRMALRLSRDGRRLQLLGGTIVSRISAHSAWGITDAAGRLALRLSRDGRRFQTLGWALELAPDGTSILRSADGTAVLTVRIGETPVLAGAATTTPLPKVADGRGLTGSDIVPLFPDPAKWAGWGSSTMDRLNAPLASLAATYGASYNRGGRGGEWSYHHAGRMGARPLTLTAAGGAIPAIGAVDVTVTNVPTSHPFHYVFEETEGTWGGIAGRLSAVWGAGGAGSAGSTYRFTRAADGDAVPLAAGTPFIPKAALTLRDAVVILNCGKNDLTMLADPQGVIDRTNMMFDYLTPFAKRCLVMNHFVDTAEADGSALHGYVATVNAAYAARYGGLVVDLRGWLRGVQMYGQTVWTKTGITPTADDQAAMTASRKPPSLSSDSLHMNDAADASVVWLIQQKLVELGWYKG